MRAITVTAFAALLGGCSEDTIVNKWGNASEFDIFVWVCVIVGIVVGPIYIYTTEKAKRIKREKLAAVGITDTTYLGYYVTGHPSMPRPRSLEVCANGPSFRLIRPTDGEILAEIPRDAITAMEVIDKSKVEHDKRYTLTRVALLGVFALAAPKTKTTVTNEFLLSVQWNAQGVKLTTYFSFSDLVSANTALSAFMNGRT